MKAIILIIAVSLLLNGCMLLPKPVYCGHKKHSNVWFCTDR